MDNITYILNMIDGATATYISDVVARLAITLNATFRNLLILFFILYGLGIWQGKIKTDAMEFFWNVIRVSVIYGLVFGIAIYNGVIVDLLTNGPDTLAGIVAGQTTNSASQAIGLAYDRSLAAAAQAYDSSGYVMPFVVGTIILLSGTVVMLFAVFLIGLAKIALSILVAIGPVAIIMLLFQGTRKMFEAWLQQCINFFLIVVLTVSTLTLLGDMYRRVIERIHPDNIGSGTDIELGMVIPLLIVGFLIMLVLKQVPAIASAIAGGVQISSLGAEGAPGRYLSGVYNRWQMQRAFRGRNGRGSRFTNPFQRRNSVRNS